MTAPHPPILPPPMGMLLRAAGLRKAFLRPLFSGVSLVIEDGERLALIGPNGSGKSTLLKVLGGIEPADEGEVTRRRGVRLQYVAQTDTFADGDTALTAVVRAVMEMRPEHVHDEHEAETHARVALDLAGFADPDQPAAAMSGGWRKRLSIVRASASEPDVLMLDEPTNHLDLEGILWLEELVKRSEHASVFVSHDRSFLERVSMRIVELSRAYPQGTFTSVGAYDQFLSRREDFLGAQEKEQQSLKGTVAEDTRWLSRGAKARRTKSKSRIQAAAERRDELAAMRERTGAATSKAAGIEFTATGRQTHRLLRAHNLRKSFGTRVLFDGLSFTLSPGSCLGLLGPNGSGKTSLIRLLTGDDKPDDRANIPAEDRPRIERADGLRTVVFTQKREVLDPTQTLKAALGGESDGVIYRGQTMHINTWATRFLFRPEQLRSPVGSLSGGEQARVVIAKMMLDSADLLILDEPTNDLDIASLEVLEESLEEFPGAILLVTHDRAMLDRLSTEIIALDGKGGWANYADLNQWESAKRSTEQAETDARKAAAAPAKERVAAPGKAKKLPYHEQREFDGMEKAIAAAEAEAALLEKATHDPAAMADHRKMGSACAALSAATGEVARLYERWAELEAKQAGG